MPYIYVCNNVIFADQLAQPHKSVNQKCN